jgi:outer membrane protein OmpA-like peptidoglycan-associated protein
VVIGTVLTLSGFTLGCATSRSIALERARAAYTEAQRDPNIATHAPVALHEAEAALRRAERAWEEDGDEREVEHLAYLTEQKVAIARAQAQQKMADAEVQRLGEQREQVIITARTREVEQRTAQVKRLQQELAELQAQQTDRGIVLTLGDVLFETGKSELKPGAFRNLNTLVTFLRENPKRDVLVEGHTDNQGSDAFNLELSQRRAESVRNYLLSNGIPPERIIARGYGEAYPVAPNETSAGRQQNRRVEIVVLNEGERATQRMRF